MLLCHRLRQRQQRSERLKASAKAAPFMMYAHDEAAIGP
jgi:hypothetical protein